MPIFVQPNAKVDDILIEILSSTREDLQTRLQNIRVALIEAEKTYEEKGAIRALNQISTMLAIGNVEARELIKLYTQKIVSKKSGSRHFYDEILALNLSKMCPYCNTKDSATLDHYLPKKSYPQYAITPGNLVPACRDCNFKKQNYIPQSNEDLFLHPYFEDDPGFIWLVASLQQTEPVSFAFGIAPSSSGSNIVLLKRLKKQFDSLNLSLVYGAYSANEWSSIQYYISELPDENAISRYISGILDSFERYAPNSWKAAMYRSMSNSSWLLNKGFLR